MSYNISCLHISNVPVDFDLLSLREEFEKFGPVTRFFKVNGKPFGFVEFETREQAEECLNKFSGYKIDDEHTGLNLDFARGKPRSERERFEGRGGAYRPSYRDRYRSRSPKRYDGRPRSRSPYSRPYGGGGGGGYGGRRSPPPPPDYGRPPRDGGHYRDRPPRDDYRDRPRYNDYRPPRDYDRGPRDFDRPPHHYQARGPPPSYDGGDRRDRGYNDRGGRGDYQEPPRRYDHSHPPPPPHPRDQNGGYGYGGPRDERPPRRSDYGSEYTGGSSSHRSPRRDRSNGPAWERPPSVTSQGNGERPPVSENGRDGEDYDKSAPVSANSNGKTEDNWRNNEIEIIPPN